MKSWQEVSLDLEGAKVRGISVSDRRTYVLWAATDRGMMLTRDGGLSWRVAAEAGQPEIKTPRFNEWQRRGGTEVRIGEAGALLRREGEGDGTTAMQGWRIPRATSVFVTRRGFIAGGPGGVYCSEDGRKWSELVFWRPEQTGPADYLHAYWMGRYYSFTQ